MDKTILVYTDQNIKRVQYVANFILIGYNILVTDKADYFNSFIGIKINYSTKSFEGVLNLFPDGLLKKPINPLLIPCFINQNQDVKAYFYTSKENYPQHLSFDFDVFAFIFYCLTRLEEYSQNIKTDIHQRVCGKSCYAFKNNFHQIPIVDIITNRFNNILFSYNKNYIIPIFNNKTIVTIDIDRLFLYKYKPFFKTIGSIIKNIVFLHFRETILQFKFLFNSTEDPHNNVIQNLEYFNQKNISTIFFWLLADQTKFDNNINYLNSEQINIIKHISSLSFVGIHPSYYSIEKENLIPLEINRLFQIINKPINHSRFHYLRFRIPKEYRKLIENKIFNDYSMGWHDIIGFRAGTSKSFYWYDLENDFQTELSIHPFVAMDVTLKNYMKLEFYDASELLKEIKKTIYNTGGNFSILLHNESLSEYGKWKNWPIKKWI